MSWTSKDGPKCPVSPEDRGEFMNPKANQITATPIADDTPTCIRCGARVHSPCETDAQEDRCELPPDIAVSRPECK